MQILSNAPQGSASWLKARAGRFCASEAAAAMGVSKYTTRDALLHQKATGITEEVGPAKQRIFDAGHAAEAAARPIAEAHAGTDLFPVVAVLDLGGLPLLASLDGIDMLEEMVWEHKLLNESLVSQVTQGVLVEPHYWAQLEHQLLVSGASRALFTTSDGTAQNMHSCWYESLPHRRAELIAAWHQFAKDLAAYVPPAAQAAPVVGRAPEHLPALRIEVNGAVTASNLAEFKATAMAAIDGVNRVLATDADFADAEASVKWCSEVESRLAAAKQHALSQTVDIDALFRTMDDIAAEARRVRLELAGLVKQRKETLRGEIVAGGVAALRTHVENLNLALGRHYVPLVLADFGGAVKGKRSIDSMQGAVNDELARAKIAANEVATRIQTNLKALHDTEGVVLALFPDMATLVLKGCEDFAAVVQNRHAQHAEKERQRMDAERERIRAEEQAKAQREAEASHRAFIEAKEREVQRAADAQLAQEMADAQAEAIAVEPATSWIDAPKQMLVIQEKTQALIAMNRCCEKAVAEGVGICSGCRENWIEQPAGDVAEAQAPQPDTGERINLSAINDHLAPISINAAGLALLGFEPVATVKASKLYPGSDLPRIRDALVRHLQSLALQAA